MLLDNYKTDGHRRVKLDDFPTSGKNDGIEKEKILKQTEKNQEKITELQDKLYADGKEGIIIVLQAMDAAGKDSTIKHVLSGVNPQGVKVTSFKQPNSTELAHDYLWRVNEALPRRGMIAIFNRSYYEDVLVVKVHDLYKGYNMASRTIDDSEEEFFARRLKQLSNYEEYLYDNSYRIVKIFLHVSPEEQKKRFLERIDDKAKNWKFSSSDLKERAYWNDYMDAYEDAINATATEHSPWYIIPADQKWYTRYLVSEAIVSVLEACHSKYPQLDKENIEHLALCKAALLAESGDKPDSPKKSSKIQRRLEDEHCAENDS